MSGYKLLDTRKFDEFISNSSNIRKEYDDINLKYKEAMSALKENWRGKGADQFFSDAKMMQSNLDCIADILQTMCDRLIDCRDVFSETDTTIGEENKKL